VELIISIAILAIVMIPIMGNFFRSMQLNKKAEDLQVQSNLASNIM
jgi:type II secretory pathway pseudopilin PulG